MLALAILLANCGLLGLIVIFRKKGILSQFAARKALHLLSAIGAIVATTLVNQQSFLFVTGFFCLLYAGLFFRQRLRAIEPAHLKTYGAPLYPFGVFVLALTLWSNPDFLRTGILILGVPDVLAAFVQNFWKKPIGQVLVARFIVYCAATAGALLFVADSFWFVLVGSVVLGVVEYASPNGTDNFTVPVTTAVLFLFFL